MNRVIAALLLRVRVQARCARLHFNFLQCEKCRLRRIFGVAAFVLEEHAGDAPDPWVEVGRRGEPCLRFHIFDRSSILPAPPHAPAAPCDARHRWRESTEGVTHRRAHARLVLESNYSGPRGSTSEALNNADWAGAP